MVYLLPFLSYLAGSNNVSACPPIRPVYDDRYRSRCYRFVEQQKSISLNEVLHPHDTYNKSRNEDAKVTLFGFIWIECDMEMHDVILADSQ